MLLGVSQQRLVQIVTITFTQVNFLCSHARGDLHQAVPLPADDQHHVTSSCTGQAAQSWNSRHIRLQLEDWLDSLQPVRAGQNLGSVQERYFDRSGKYLNQIQGTSTSRSTVGKFSGSVFQGLVWQWRGDHSIDGFLYGRVDQRGRFTGSNITFIYPDLITG